MRHWSSRLAWRVWILDKRARRDAALDALATETEPAKRDSLRAIADRYEAMLRADLEEQLEQNSAVSGRDARAF
jgi:hypothetical protein